MALSISASRVSSLNFSLNETNNNESLSLSDSLSSTSSYTYGSGNQQITNAISMTGVLNSGSFVLIDVYKPDQTVFGSTTKEVTFSKIKNFTVQNLDTQEGYDFTVVAAGSNACTNLFNGGSGNLMVKPYSNFSYNDPYSGFSVDTTQRYVTLSDLGSGVAYKVMILGVEE